MAKYDFLRRGLEPHSIHTECITAYRDIHLAGITAMFSFKGGVFLSAYILKTSGCKNKLSIIQRRDHFHQKTKFKREKQKQRGI